jgi:short-subunit dehydrogenase
MPRWDLRGKVALITGASAGIGRSLAIELAKRGMHLGLAARSMPELEAAAEACHAFGVRALPVSTDVGNEAECQRFVETAAREFGRIDLLVNNAGIGMWARFEDVTDLSIFERLMRINYLGTVWTTHAALPQLIDSRGLIVGISSLTGKTGVPTRSGYAASKHAMQGFLDSIRVELEGRVDVSVISPGFVSTDIRARGLGADGKPRGESPRNEDHGNMSVDECVALIVKAIEQREREVVMTAKARAGLWLKLIAPKLVDRMAAKAVRER